MTTEERELLRSMAIAFDWLAVFAERGSADYALAEFSRLWVQSGGRAMLEMLRNEEPRQAPPMFVKVLDLKKGGEG